VIRNQPHVHGECCKSDSSSCSAVLWLSVSRLLSVVTAVDSEPMVVVVSLDCPFCWSDEVVKNWRSGVVFFVQPRT